MVDPGKYYAVVTDRGWLVTNPDTGERDYGGHPFGNLELFETEEKAAAAMRELCGGGWRPEFEPRSPRIVVVVVHGY